MKKLNNANKEVIEMDCDELRNVTGGGDIIGYVKCVSATLTTAGGGVRTFLLGTTLFGMARALGVMVGCL